MGITVMDKCTFCGKVPLPGAVEIFLHTSGGEFSAHGRYFHPVIQDTGQEATNASVVTSCADCAAG